jgi:hypothetical protein
MALAAAHELARAAEERGIHDENILCRMDEWEVVTRLAAATAIKAQEQGFARIVPGYDLDRMQLADLLAMCPGVTFEVIVHSHVPMFHMQHCLFASGLSAGRGCGDCGRPCVRHELSLRDRIVADHPVLVDATGRNTVFNSGPRSMKASRRPSRDAPIPRANGPHPEPQDPSASAAG